MDKLRRHLSACASLALVAILALATMPAASRLLGAMRGDIAAPLCTAAGIRYGAPGDAASFALEGDACPFCTLAANAPGLAPTALQFTPARLAATLVPRARQTPWLGLHLWDGALARAPPAAA